MLVKQKNLLNGICCALGLFICAAVAAETPKRIVSLDMCTDWMLAKYADPAQVLALSSYVKRYPPTWLDRAWTTHNGSLEELLALKPDLVLVGEFNASLLRQRLRDFGIKVEVLPMPHNLAQVDEYEKTFFALIGSPEQRLAKPQAKELSSRRLLLLGSNGIGTGMNTLEADVIRYAGWTNYIKDEGYVHLDLEKLITDPPDAILWAAPRSAALANEFAEHPALKKLLSDDRLQVSDYWRWQCPGPWTWELVSELARRSLF